VVVGGLWKQLKIETHRGNNPQQSEGAKKSGKKRRKSKMSEEVKLQGDKRKNMCRGKRQRRLW
jgi:hypothetical protein